LPQKTGFLGEYGVGKRRIEGETGFLACSARFLFKIDKGSKEAACLVGHTQETQLLAIVTQSSVGGEKL